ncbi:MAG: RNA ligase family protein [Candidatus Heimdallarchaeaceae archaeon]
MDKIKYKPLGIKNYGHISHLPNSRIGIGDHKCSKGQAKIACVERRDKYDNIIVLEKLDGSNVGVCLKNGCVLPLTRTGYLANSSPFKMHHEFNVWVYENEDRFRSVLSEGERICGEWLLVAHGTRYKLKHEPFVVFDYFNKNNQRIPFAELMLKAKIGNFIIPYVISIGPSISVEDVLNKLGKYGYHGALEEVEGAVWRVERDVLINKKEGNKKGRTTVVDFLVKYVREDKEDGKYLKSNSGKIIYNIFE